jgi:hypothetical protein
VFKPGFLFRVRVQAWLPLQFKFLFKFGYLCSSTYCSSLATSSVQLCVQASKPQPLTSRRNISSSFRAHLLCA